MATKIKSASSLVALPPYLDFPIWNMTAELHALDIPIELVNGWHSLATSLQDKRVTCWKQSKWIIEKAERNIRQIEQYGRTENSLGVLQGSAPELDRLCGEMDVARLALVTFASVIATTLAKRIGWDAERRNEFVERFSLQFPSA